MLAMSYIEPTSLNLHITKFVASDKIVALLIKGNYLNCLMYRLQLKRKKPRLMSWFLIECWQWVIFPAGFPTSIVTAVELNFCVRYGNRWASTLESPTMVEYLRMNFSAHSQLHKVELFVILSILVKTSCIKVLTKI